MLARFAIVLYSLLFVGCWCTILRTKSEIEIKKPYSLIKGSRNAIFLLDGDGKRHLFPDFYTFSTLGFSVDEVKKISDERLSQIDLAEIIKAIPAPPPFRPDDYMFHTLCDDPRRLIDEINVVPNLGNFQQVMQTVSKKGSLDILFLGGSITAGGYFMEFIRTLQEKTGLNITYHNHGHGATDILYSIYCVEIDHYRPDIVMIDFAVNDIGHPKVMDALIRKVKVLPSFPLVVLVNLWVASNCPPPRYFAHATYYQIPLINVCSAVNLCFGKRLPKSISDQYSRTDGVHPWGSRGVSFLGQILYAWWQKMQELVSEDIATDAMYYKTSLEHARSLPPPLFHQNPIGSCTKCEALVGDANDILTPIGTPKGFRIVTRTKIGFGGFGHPQFLVSNDTVGALNALTTRHLHQPHAKSHIRNTTSSSYQSHGSTLGHQRATRSFKKSWQAETVGSTISFPFYGSSVSIAIWQRRDDMGILHAVVDGDKRHVAKASGFFKGYTWAMEKNNTGRSEIIPLFEGLEDKEHVLTLTVSAEPANVWVPGHTCQVFALLSASNDVQCKDKPVRGTATNLV